jgi:myo-inositol-1(or 4)-monophosphatase
MPAPPPIDLAALAERTARAAGALVVDHLARGAVAVESKSSATDMVSAADRASEQLLVELLTAARPDDGMIGEEGTERAGSTGLTWVCDPLDGTTNYLYGLPQWAVSVAVEDADGPLAACVFDPSRDEAFTAARGEGAVLNGRPIRVSASRELATSLIGTGFAYQAEVRAAQGARMRDVLAQVRDIRRAGSAALDLAWVACGRLDGFFESGIQHWDYAGGMLLVPEAGGLFAVGPGPHDGILQVVASGPGIHGALRALADGNGSR